MAHYTRTATTVNEQIDILFRRGLDITVDDQTIHRLENIGYFKFKGYCFPFYSEKDKFALKNPQQNKKYTFDEIYQSYMLDQKLHLLLLGLTNRIETQFKARLGYYIAMNYGPLGYKNKALFRNEELYNNWQARSQNGQQNALERNESYVKHYQTDYENDFPIWVVLEMASFGDVSKLFSDISTVDQKTFARQYGQSYVYVKSWIHFIVAVRNYCAHNSRTFRRQFHVAPRIDSKEKRLVTENYLNFGNLFSALFVAKKMCKSRRYFDDTVASIKHYFAAYPLVDIGYFGFPNNWESILANLVVS
ncbi:Abi family protein [Loigolactobacillus jiayinensis]|uniref:Abi family protein n=1 Tax=Loigolactobacillus jiayinensis TaxID=2486016 RepID=A0ABW1R9W5_9LACO|nr:Abi family protein [Loigolactobacillus jiayinensis]